MKFFEVIITFLAFWFIVGEAISSNSKNFTSEGIPDRDIHKGALSMTKRKINDQLALAFNQPERKYRHVFTRTFYKRTGWRYSMKQTKLVLDIDEYGITFNNVSIAINKPKNDYFSAIYEGMEKIVVDRRKFLIKVTMGNLEGFSQKLIDLKQLDGDLWSNYCAIQWTLEKFAKAKLEYNSIDDYKEEG